MSARREAPRSARNSAYSSCDSKGSSPGDDGALSGVIRLVVDEFEALLPVSMSLGECALLVCVPSPRFGRR